MNTITASVPLHMWMLIVDGFVVIRTFTPTHPKCVPILNHYRAVVVVVVMVLTTRIVT